MAYCSARRKPPRAALITGASRGIGKAFAQALPPSTHLVLTARSRPDLDALQASLESDAGRTVTAVDADLADPAGIEKVCQAANEAKIDLLIANAGMGVYGRFLDRPAGKHRATVDLNINAVLGLLHSILPDMVVRARENRRRAGVIVMGSSAGFVPVPNLATYAATKAFLLSFSEALSAELATEPVDILCACPGATRTGFGRSAGFQVDQLPFAMEPGDVARKALRALGRRRTLLIESGPGKLLQPAADARSLFAGLLRRSLDGATAARRR